jgi:hypothetical protein
MDIHETLKKIGLPATVAAVVTSIVIAAPIMFKVDERYAKHSDVKEEIARLRTENNELRHELAQLNGFQQAMAALIQSGKITHPTAFEGTSLPFSSFMIKVQDAAKAAPAAVPSAPAGAASAPAKPPAKPPVKPQQKIEKPSTWKELNEGLYRQSQRLMKD